MSPVALHAVMSERHMAGVHEVLDQDLHPNALTMSEHCHHVSATW